MSFSYWEYFTSNLMLPVFGLAFILVPTFRLVMRLLEQYSTGKRRVSWDGQSILFFAVMVIVGVLLGKTLFTGGGVHLIYERSKAAVTVEGTLEAVEPCSIFSGIRYAAYGENSSGYEYTIDGVTLTGMAKGTLEVGDEVTVTYLPKSGFVLSIEEQ